MPGLRPTKAFTGVTLELATIRPGHRFGRIYHERYPDPLGLGKTKSRFSDPRRLREHRRFGVLYLGSTLKGCFVEAILRDRRNGAVEDYPIEEAELLQRRYAEIAVTSSLSVIDLRGDGRIRMGVPSDVVGSTRQTLARAWSLAIYNHPAAPDGIIYSSRLNDDTNLAVYDRAIVKLRAERSFDLIKAPGFAEVLNTLKVALI
jgi:RES domain-containing protein